MQISDYQKMCELVQRYRIENNNLRLLDEVEEILYKKKDCVDTGFTLFVVKKEEHEDMFMDLKKASKKIIKNKIVEIEEEISKL